MRIAITLAGACLLAAILPAAGPARADALTIYRCVDPAGRVMLRDSPCPAGQRQEARRMLRPQDGAAPTSTPVPAAVTGTATPAAAPHVVLLTAPRPMYECSRPDGSRYTSDSADGNPRWVPLWTLGYPVLRERHVVVPGHAHIEVRDGRVGGALRTGHVERQVRPTMAGYGAGTWVRDACHALPQAEVCARLRDERSALRTRFFNAQPSERDRITVQERGINARLANDCGES